MFGLTLVHHADSLGAQCSRFCIVGVQGKRMAHFIAKDPGNENRTASYRKSLIPSVGFSLYLLNFTSVV